MLCKESEDTFNLNVYSLIEQKHKLISVTQFWKPICVEHSSFERKSDFQSNCCPFGFWTKGQSVLYQSKRCPFGFWPNPRRVRKDPLLIYDPKPETASLKMWLFCWQSYLFCFYWVDGQQNWKPPFPKSDFNEWIDTDDKHSLQHIHLLQRNSSNSKASEESSYELNSIVFVSLHIFLLMDEPSSKLLCLLKDTN